MFLLTVGPCVTTVLTKIKREYFAHARGINFFCKIPFSSANNIDLIESDSVTVANHMLSHMIRT